MQKYAARARLFSFEMDRREALPRPRVAIFALSLRSPLGRWTLASFIGARKFVGSTDAKSGSTESPERNSWTAELSGWICEADMFFVALPAGREDSMAGRPSLSGEF